MKNTKKCCCIMSGYANTTNYCPVHRSNKKSVYNFSGKKAGGRFQLIVRQSELHEHQVNYTPKEVKIEPIIILKPLNTFGRLAVNLMKFASWLFIKSGNKL